MAKRKPKRKKKFTFSSVGEWLRYVEDDLYGQQYNVIKREYNQAAADSANYGWGVNVDSGHGRAYLSVATKVYRDGGQILTSEAKYPSTHVTHVWSDYG
jgi:hypothetical protein